MTLHAFVFGNYRVSIGGKGSPRVANAPYETFSETLVLLMLA